MTTYEIVKNSVDEEILKRTDADGSVWWIPTDPSNSDYQAYLKRDEPKVEHLTDVVK